MSGAPTPVAGDGERTLYGRIERSSGASVEIVHCHREGRDAAQIVALRPDRPPFVISIAYSQLEEVIAALVEIQSSVREAPRHAQARQEQRRREGMGRTR